MNPVETEAKDRKYFSSIRNYTLALLNSFNNVKYWVEQDINTNQKEYTIPIAFGNYEKAAKLDDVDEDTITKGNYNFLPRIVLTFEGMTKAPERQTNKFQKLSKKIYTPGQSNLDLSYNSVAYDFTFGLLVQSRGLTITSQIVEQILIKFNPTLNLNIQEFPIYDSKTETQIKISDPEFEIMEEFDETDTNIINTTFVVEVRGNIYSPIEIQGGIEIVEFYSHVWDEQETEQAKLSAFYKYDLDNTTAVKETERHYTGGIPYDDHVRLEDTDTMESERPDFYPPETENIIE